MLEAGDGAGSWAAVGAGAWSLGEAGRVGLIDADWPGHRAGRPSRFDMRPGAAWLLSWVAAYLLAGALYTLSTALAAAGRNLWVQPLGAAGYIGKASTRPVIHVGEFDLRS